MKPTGRLLCFQLILVLSMVVWNASAQKAGISKEPSWVAIQQYDYSSSAMEDEAEDGYIDLAYENQISVGQQSIYCRKVLKILSEAGIQNSSEISANFDPSFQQIFFHTISIIRKGKIIDQLKPGRIKTIQREKEMENYQYDGSLTAFMFLEDIRKGDIIDYSFTIKGANPVFNGKFSKMLDLNYSVPMVNLFYRLLVPNDRNLKIQNKDATIQPQVLHLGNELVYEWKAKNIPALKVENNTPSWYDPYSMVMVSEYRDWKEVNDWALKLFPVPSQLSPGLKKKAIEIMDAFPNTRKAIVAALRFVEDDVRYLGIEVGQNTHRPANPNKTFAQRYGDCKDKSYLLCTLLRAIGVNAWPVMINSRYKKTITEWLPTPLAFDHATVKAEIDGKEYWFDPTIPFQRGSLDDISYPDYQYGLVVSENTNSLSPIPLQEPGAVDIREEFFIPNMWGRAQLKVTSRFTGSYADVVRSEFNSSSLGEIRKNYRDYYVNYYKGLTADSIAFKDDDSTGTFITWEYYKIDSLWELEDGIKKSYYNPYVIEGILKETKETVFGMPYSITFPARYHESVVINLPEEWSFIGGDEHIKTAAFTFDGNFRYSFRTITLSYDYEATKDFISPQESAEFVAALNKKRKDFGYSLTYGTGSKKKVKSLDDSIQTSNIKVYVSLAGIAVLVFLAWYRGRTPRGKWRS